MGRRTIGAMITGAALCVLGGLAPVAAGPVTVDFSGALGDGGFFDGWMTYDDEDFEPGVIGSARYQGLVWEVNITGGAATGNATLSNLLPGRALVETLANPPIIGPLPGIALVFLSPDTGLPSPQNESPKLTLAFAADPGYDPDVQPQLSDFGALVPALSEYRDSNALPAIPISVRLGSTNVVSEPAGLYLLLPGVLFLLGWWLFGARPRAPVSATPQV